MICLNQKIEKIRCVNQMLKAIGAVKRLRINKKIRLRLQAVLGGGVKTESKLVKKESHIQ